jgi:hypothetical protein
VKLFASKTLSVGLAALACLLTAANVSTAGLMNISHFHLTSNSMSFDINGTFEDPFPQFSPQMLLFVNPNANSDPGFALGHFYNSASSSFTGSQALKSENPIHTGNAFWADYFSVEFNRSFQVGDQINGTVSAAWSGTAFDPSAVTSLNVFWGHTISSSEGGTLIGTVVVTGVPEIDPSSFGSALALVLGSLGLFERRRAR